MRMFFWADKDFFGKTHSKLSMEKYLLQLAREENFVDVF